jgi:hypothetical protein
MFYLPAHILILVGLIMLVERTERPFLCSGIYAGLHLFFSLLLGVPWLTMLILGAVAFGLASVYFWLLSRIEPGHTIWWIVVIGGILIGLV